MPKKKKEERKARRAYTRPVADTRALTIRVCEQISEKGIYAIMLLVPVVFLSNCYWPFDISKVTFLRILALLVLGGYIGKIIATREWKIVKPPALMWWPILLYVGLYSLSTIFSISPDLSLQSGEGRNFGLISLVAMVALYFLVINIMTERRQLMRCIDLFLISTTIVAFMGILQVYGHSVDIMSSTMDRRASSTFGNPDFLFALMILALPLSYGCLIKERNWIRGALYFIASVILGWCILLSMPRLFGKEISLLIALLMPVFILGMVSIPRFLEEKKQRVVVYSSLGVLIFIVIALLIVVNAGGVRDNIAGYEKRFLGENTDRYMLAEIALDAVPDHPLLGSGPNTFRNTFPEYATLEYAEHAPERREDKVHNSYVETLSTNGWLGFLSYIFMQIAIFGYLLKWIWTNRHKRAAILVFWMLLAGVVYMAHTAFMFHTTVPYTFFWILIAVALSLTLMDDRRVKTLSWRMPDAVCSILLAVLVILIGVSIFIAVRPLVANAYYYHGERQMSRQNLAAAQVAIPSYESAIQWNGSEVRYRWSYAIALLNDARLQPTEEKEKERCEMVREVINDAIEMEPESAMLYYNRGIMMAQCGASREEVLADVDKAIEMYPTGYMARRYRAQLNTEMGNLEQAIEDDEIAQAVKPNHNGWIRLGNNHVSLGDQYLQDDDPNTSPEYQYGQAVEALLHAVEEQPADATANYLLAVAYDKSGNTEKAVESYLTTSIILRQFIQDKPGNVEAHYMLGYCYERTGDVEKAIEEYNTVLELQPNHQRAKEGLKRLGINTE